jgi:hypothetical protein
MTKNYCDKCESNFRSKVALEESNDWLHGLREVFVFNEMSDWALQQGYCIFEVKVVNSFANIKKEKKVYREFQAHWAKMVNNKLEWGRQTAPNMDELYSKVMGNGSDKDEDLL